jgi:hypothetical protein
LPFVRTVVAFRAFIQGVVNDTSFIAEISGWTI